MSLKPLDPVRYHVNPKSDLTDLAKGMPWRSVQDEFGKYKWIDYEGRTYQGTSYAIEQDPTEKTLFVVSMMHSNTVKPNAAEPDVTCPGDVVDNDRRDEVVHHEEIPGQAEKKSPRTKDDKKSTFTNRPRVYRSHQGQWLGALGQ